MKKKVIILCTLLATLLLMPVMNVKAETKLPELAKDQVTLAVGTKEKINLDWTQGMDKSDYEIEYKIETGKERFIQVDEDGQITGVVPNTEGVDVYCTVSHKDSGRSVEYDVRVFVTQPAISSLNPNMIPKSTKTLLITGVNPNMADTYCSVEDSSVATVKVENPSWGIYQVKVTSKKIGVTKATVVIDHKEYIINIMVTNPILSTDWILAAPGGKRTITMTGITHSTTPVWSSSDSSIASVTQAGVVTLKKKGNATLTVKVDGVSRKCAISLTYKKAIDVINTGKKKLGIPYSQAYRMKSNYFDCSSFAWRIYKANKVYMCNKSGWAPVAAAEAQYLKNKGKVISYGYASESKLLAGDLIFIKGSYNARYRNICHVAMYIGNGKLLHSTPPCVQYGTYNYYKNRITLIGRPLK